MPDPQPTSCTGTYSKPSTRHPHPSTRHLLIAAASPSLEMLQSSVPGVQGLGFRCKGPKLWGPKLGGLRVRVWGKDLSLTKAVVSSSECILETCSHTIAIRTSNALSGSYCSPHIPDARPPFRHGIVQHTNLENGWHWLPRIAKDRAPPAQPHSRPPRSDAGSTPDKGNVWAPCKILCRKLSEALMSERLIRLYRMPGASQLL